MTLADYHITILLADAKDNPLLFLANIEKTDFCNDLGTVENERKNYCNIRKFMQRMMKLAFISILQIMLLKANFCSEGA